MSPSLEAAPKRRYAVPNGSDGDAGGGGVVGIGGGVYPPGAVGGPQE